MKTSIIAATIGAIVAVASIGTTEGFSAAPPAIKKEINMKYIRKSIDQLTAENFDATLKEIEPFLLTTAGSSFYKKSQSRIARNAKVIGATVPTDYAKEAKATLKKREKQDAYVKAKIEEAAEASAEEEEAPAEEEAEPAAEE